MITAFKRICRLKSAPFLLHVFLPVAQGLLRSECGCSACGHKSVSFETLPAGLVRHKALPLPCVSTVFLSKTAPFLAVLHNTQPLELPEPPIIHQRLTLARVPRAGAGGGGGGGE
eukprot:SAG22_NODE_4443_length_1268_cov_1.579127_1_plen_115_part_00